jgi:hypothetical protein
LESARQFFASTPRHYQSHPGTRFPLRAMAGDPVPPADALETFRPRDRSISFYRHPLRRQDSIFALCSPSSFRRLKGHAHTTTTATSAQRDLYRTMGSIRSFLIHRRKVGSAFLDERRKTFFLALVSATRKLQISLSVSPFFLSLTKYWSSKCVMNI